MGEELDVCEIVRDTKQVAYRCLRSLLFATENLYLTGAAKVHDFCSTA